MCAPDWPPARLPGELPDIKYRAPVAESLLSAEDIHAAAEVHGELGPDYGDAVVETFLARIDQHIEARIEQRLGSRAGETRRPIDPVRLTKYRTVFAGVVVGSAVLGWPLSVVALNLLRQFGNSPMPLIGFWVVLLPVYGLAAYRRRRR